MVHFKNYSIVYIRFLFIKSSLVWHKDVKMEQLERIELTINVLQVQNVDH